MRVALLGGGLMAGDVSKILAALGRQDSILVTGATEGIVGNWLRKYRKRNTWPAVEAYYLEADRYGEDRARQQLAMQLVMGGAGAPPAAIVLAGDPDPVLQQYVMDMAERLPSPVPIRTADEFRASRVEA